MPMTVTTQKLTRPRPRLLRWTFVILMLALMLLCLALGSWQVQRLAEKEALITRVAERMTAAPVPFPPPSDWDGLDPQSLDYRPVSVVGHFVPDQAVLVFTALREPRGEASGPGYWVMTPFALQGGGAIFVNRGFVPEREFERFLNDPDIPPGEVALTGIGRASEQVNSFTPGPNLERRLDFSRSVDRLARQVDPALGPFAPVYLDLPAEGQGALPQGGETVLAFPNNHLGYAITWFGFAALTPIMLGWWLRLERRQRLG